MLKGASLDFGDVIARWVANFVMGAVTDPGKITTPYQKLKHIELSPQFSWRNRAGGFRTLASRSAMQVVYTPTSKSTRNSVLVVLLWGSIAGFELERLSCRSTRHRPKGVMDSSQLHAEAFNQDNGLSVQLTGGRRPSMKVGPMAPSVTDPGKIPTPIQKLKLIGFSPLFFGGGGAN